MNFDSCQAREDDLNWQHQKIMTFSLRSQVANF